MIAGTEWEQGAFEVDVLPLYENDLKRLDPFVFNNPRWDNCTYNDWWGLSRHLTLGRRNLNDRAKTEHLKIILDNCWNVTAQIKDNRLIMFRVKNPEDFTRNSTHFISSIKDK